LFKTNSGNLWLVSKVKLDHEAKIILEVVPWVDKKLSRGWSTENRNYIINQCKTSLARSMPNSDDFASAYSKNRKNILFKSFKVASNRTN
jgi:uncharacterized membrane protein YheB (UPF0754 family)